jgi:hypothetical protein
MAKARLQQDRAADRGAPVAETLGDLRFRALLGAPAWSKLPAPVRRRFSARLRTGAAMLYKGEIGCCRMSRPGWLLAQGCRLIGAPLPLGRESGLAACVTVTEDGESGGQVWTRMYARPGGFPQVIHSAKRFAGPTGLEEYLGCGCGIALRVEPIDGGIAFCSDHYFLRLGLGRAAGRRLRLPRWIAPGTLRIEHVDRGGGRFDFVLSLRHRLLGELIHQLGHFYDQGDAVGEEG